MSTSLLFYYLCFRIWLSLCFVCRPPIFGNFTGEIITIKIRKKSFFYFTSDQKKFLKIVNETKNRKCWDKKKFCLNFEMIFKFFVKNKLWSLNWKIWLYFLFLLIILFRRQLFSKISIDILLFIYLSNIRINQD